MIIFLGTLTITCIQRFRQNQANETVYRRKVKGSITTDWASSHYWSQRYTPRIIVQYQSTLSTFSTYKFNTLFPTSPQWRMITIIPPPKQLRPTCCFGLKCLLKPFLHWAKSANLREPVFKFVCATLLIKARIGPVWRIPKKRFTLFIKNNRVIMCFPSHVSGQLSSGLFMTKALQQKAS